MGGRRGAVAAIAAALIAPLGVSACGDHIAPYPSAWPAPVPQGGCAALAGAFLARGEESPSRRGDPPDLRLFDFAGWNYAQTPWPRRPDRVRLVPEPGKLRIVFPDPDRLNHLVPDTVLPDLATKLTCTAEGAEVLRPGKFVNANVALVSTATTWTLSRAEDGGLIVRQEERTRGIALVVPFGEREVRWFRFPPAP